jgi:asparagine synthase (glutamine-hydrolysing)
LVYFEALEGKNENFGRTWKMCGITGLYPFNEIGRFHSINLQSSISSLRHRGPDGMGTYLSDKGNLGHTRLSIIDLTDAARQPMKDESGRYVISFNGEIYNFKDLRKDLERSGVKFKSSSDTEVLLYHLIEKGIPGLSDLNGFFSLAFYDSQEESLLLARDRFGIKPLVYYHDDDKLVFSSELGALRAFGLPELIDPDSLFLFLSLNYIPAPQSIYKGFRKLRPGHYIEVRNKNFKEKRWYSPTSRTISDNFESIHENASRVKELLFSSVEKRLVADVQLGAFLSGGIDSSIISFIGSQLSKEFKTFSVGLEGNSFLDESKYAEEVAQFLGTEHVSITLNPRFFLETIDALLKSKNEPFADSSAIAVYGISKETRKHVTVALSGDGADELFGGYYKYQAFLRSFQPGVMEFLLGLGHPLLSLFPSSRDGNFSTIVRRLKRYSKAARLPLSKRYWEWSSPVGSSWPSEILSASLKRENPIIEEAIKLDLFPNRAPKEINEVLDNDLAMVLSGDMLQKVDQASMQNSLEVRVPFLDHELVEFVTGLPSGQKVMRGRNKILLREAFKNDLPSNVFDRPKKGFEIPLNSWLTKDLRNRVEDDWLRDNDNPLEEFINMERLKKLRKDLLNKKGQNSAERAWALICLHEFLTKK